MLYELRIYQAAPGKLQAVHDRFANVTLGFFRKHGIKVVGFWTPETGENVSNTLVYMTAFESLADREKKWSAFQADPEWRKARAESEKDTGPLVVNVTNLFLRPAAYSPVQ